MVRIGLIVQLSELLRHASNEQLIHASTSSYFRSHTHTKRPLLEQPLLYSYAQPRPNVVALETLAVRLSASESFSLNTLVVIFPTQKHGSRRLADEIVQLAGPSSEMPWVIALAGGLDHALPSLLYPNQS